MPFVSPVTVHGELAQDAVIAPGAEVTVYCEIGEPPFDVGTLQLTTE